MNRLLVGAVLLSIFYNVNSLPKSTSPEEYADLSEIKNLREYIQMDTSSPDNLEPAVEFWRRQASELGLEFRVFTPGGLPIAVLTWKGTDTSLPSIMLNSHMDVVPANAAEWTYPPYEAHIDDNGDVYGRGTQDTKAIAIQQLEAIRRMKNNNETLRRTVHINITPDEEVGSDRGMKPYLESEEFNNLNVGFILDEGIPAPMETYSALYLDKRAWHMKITFYGNDGHGSTMPDDTAMDGVQKMINRLMEYREEQKIVYQSLDPTNFGAYTSVNINRLGGGTATNVIPNELSITVDIRLATDVDADEFYDMLECWMMEAGENTKIEFMKRDDVSVATVVNDTNPYWVAMQDVAEQMGIQIIPYVLPATSEMIFVRSYGIPAIGFSTFIKTPTLAHGIDEFVNAERFLEGIDVYEGLIKNLANLQ